ncbi:tyramine beta-hydroxylase-like [Saccostrea echinata]|uniref:tyramine beta-hydroxylase-like n=1 Tax=Saccostrea echinata TaxID=191078 RepID=UPI002A808805|nr:tyramine beta-hydroxylase-like [Saccostrea echinata]
MEIFSFAAFPLVTVLTLVIGPVLGYPEYVKEIPNGDKVPDPCRKDKLWKGVGHINTKGGGQRNPFGKIFAENGKTWAGIVCDSDSDGDGITNGAELGDPDCEWSKGQTPSQTHNITHPGICEPLSSEHCKKKNSWLTCPEAEPETDPFCPEFSQPDVKTVDLNLKRTRVPSKSSTWMCQILQWPSEGDYHVIGSKPLIDNSDVAHHVVAFGCSGDVEMREGPFECKMTPDKQCLDILLTWTMGSKGECLHKNEGFRVGKNGYKYIAVQVHWNNPGQKTGHEDGSGLQIFYTSNKRQFDSVIMAVGQQYLAIPPNTPSIEFNSTCPAFCTENMFQKPIFITRAVNHMHLLGIKQKVSIYRDGEILKELTNDKEYDYNSPTFYRFDPPIEVRPGDEIRTTCTYSSVGINRTTFYGDSVTDEMCFGFLTYYPQQNSYTQFCTSFKNVLLCKRYLPRLQGVYDNCSWRAFRSGQDKVEMEITKQLKSECGNKTTCSRACADAVEAMARHPCLQGDIQGYIIEHWSMREEFQKYTEMCKEKTSVTGANKSGYNSANCHKTNSVLLSIISLLVYALVHR